MNRVGSLACWVIATASVVVGRVFDRLAGLWEPPRPPADHWHPSTVDLLEATAENGDWPPTHRCVWPNCDAGITDPCCRLTGEWIDPLLLAQHPTYARLQDEQAQK